MMARSLGPDRRRSKRAEGDSGEPQKLARGTRDLMEPMVLDDADSVVRIDEPVADLERHG